MLTLNAYEKFHTVIPISSMKIDLIQLGSNVTMVVGVYRVNFVFKDKFY